MADQINEPAPTWTLEDENRLAELAYRRQRFENLTEGVPMDRLRLTIESIFTLQRSGACAVVLRKFVDNAERLRDALAPFDKRTSPMPDGMFVMISRQEIDRLKRGKKAVLCKVVGADEVEARVELVQTVAQPPEN